MVQRAASSAGPGGAVPQCQMPNQMRLAKARRRVFEDYGIR
jgi:hypothetical protein